MQTNEKRKQDWVSASANSSDDWNCTKLRHIRIFVRCDRMHKNIRTYKAIKVFNFLIFIEESYNIII